MHLLEPQIVKAPVFVYYLFMLLLYVVLILSASLLCITLLNVLIWPKVTTVLTARRVPVSVLIPARNEEANLAECLNSVLSQGDVVTEILIYDDHSTDKTSEIVCVYAVADERVRPVATVNLPMGWCGKNFACAQLAKAAQGEWMLFIDADTRLFDGAVARMVEDATNRQITLLSCWPSLNVYSFWEKALMPMLNFAVFGIYPAPLSLKRNEASLGLAHGACLLVHRSTYEAVGGHNIVRDQIFEDTRLAQLWRKLGFKSLCLDGQDVVKVRMYSSFGEIWSGFQKNFFPAFRSEVSFWVFITLHFTVFLLPFILVPLTGLFVWLKPMLWAALSVLLMRAALAIRFGQAWWSVLLHPLSELMLIVLGLSSWWRCKSGRGVEWKGRLYQANASKTETD